MSTTDKKSVNQIIVETLMETINETGSLPWQMPYRMYNSFNWYTKRVYRGVNRLLLPQGEYLTFKQLCDYNKSHGTNYRVEKGRKWRIVVFSVEKTYFVSPEKVLEEIGVPISEGDVFQGRGCSYFWQVGASKPEKRVLVRRYSKVIDHRDCVDPDTGECLPSRVETGEVTLTSEDPKKIVEGYLKREKGLKLVSEQGSIPNWNPRTDLLTMNTSHRTEAEYWSTLFHELAHSTSHPDRLNRKFPEDHGYGSDGYAREECVAEITSALLCVESGVFSVDEVQETCISRHQEAVKNHEKYEMSVFENQAAYLASWKKVLKDWDSEFLNLVTLADKAFYYVLDTNPYDPQEGGGV